MSNLKAAVHYKENEQTVTVPVEVQFKRLGRNFRAKLDLEVAFALASIPCGKCSKSTRDIMQEIGKDIDSDDMKVDVMNVVAELSNDDTRSALDPSYVFVIIRADIVEELVDTDKMVDVHINGPLGTALDKYVENVLSGKILCDGCCFASGYLDSLFPPD